MCSECHVFSLFVAFFSKFFDHRHLAIVLGRFIGHWSVVLAKLHHTYCEMLELVTQDSSYHSIHRHK